MVKRFFPHLFQDVPELAPKIHSLAERTHELTAFLVNELEKADLGTSFAGSVACHRSCHLRELEAGEEAETLIRQVSGATFVPLPRTDVCCGFGGAFSVKFPVLSGALGQAKCETFGDCQADCVVTTDAGCMMQINGILHRQGSERRVRHIAELLAGKIRNDD